MLEQSAESVPDYGKAINIKTKRGVIKPRTPNRAQYIANILDHDITFGVGPRVRVKPIWPLLLRSMRLSVRRSAVSC